jgi:hypothetical protein
VLSIPTQHVDKTLYLYHWHLYLCHVTI